MADHKSENEGFRILDEFVCEAINYPTSESDTTAAAPKRPSTLFSRCIFLVLLLVAILLVLLSLWWSGIGLENGKAVTASFVTIVVFATLGQFVRKRFRVSLKAFIMAFTILAILLGMLSQRLIEARKRSAVVERLHGLGAYVGYNYEDYVGDWFTTQDGITLPTWARKSLGDDVFADVTHIDFTGSRCRDKDLVGIHRLTRLQDLQFHNSMISGLGFKHLKGLANLKSMMIGSEQATEAGLKLLAELPNLEDLSIYGSQVTDATLVYLRHLPRLRILCLWDTNVTNDGLRHLHALENLVCLNLNSRQFGDAGMLHIKSLRGIRGLHLQRTSVSDTGILHLKDLPNLERVTLHGSPVSKEGVNRLRSALPNVDISD